MKRKNKDDITPTIKKQKGSLTAFQKKEICLALMQKTQPRQAILAEQYGVGKIRFLITRPSISVKEALGGVSSASGKSSRGFCF
jgi:hypothetical protein